VKSVGKPDARNGHVRFDERGWETGRRFGVSARAQPRLYAEGAGALLFGVQAEAVEIDACNKARKALLKAGEAIPPCFENCSVLDGLSQFFLRLCDAEHDLTWLQYSPSAIR